MKLSRLDKQYINSIDQNFNNSKAIYYMKEFEYGESYENSELNFLRFNFSVNKFSNKILLAVENDFKDAIDIFLKKLNDYTDMQDNGCYRIKELIGYQKKVIEELGIKKASELDGLMNNVYNMFLKIKKTYTELLSPTVILFCATESLKAGSTRFKNEFSNVQNVSDNKNVELYYLPTLTKRTLKKKIHNYKPEILHFACHGLNKETTLSNDCLFFFPKFDFKEDMSSNDVTCGLEIIYPDILLKQIDEEVKIIFFNACLSSGFARQIKAKFSNCRIIAAVNKVNDDDGIEFSKYFYSKYFRTNDVDSSFKFANNKIKKLNSYGGTMYILF